MTSTKPPPTEPSVFERAAHVTVRAPVRRVLPMPDEDAPDPDPDPFNGEDLSDWEAIRDGDDQYGVFGWGRVR